MTEVVDVTDPKFDFTGFFLPLTDDNCRSDAVPVDTLISTLKQYIEGGHLDPKAASLALAHYDYVLKQGLPGALKLLLKQHSFRDEGSVARFESIVAFLQQTLRYCLAWIKADASPTPYSLLNVIFDNTRALYRSSSTISALDSCVVALEAAPDMQGLRWADTLRASIRVQWDNVNNRFFAYVLNYFGKIGGFDAILARLTGPPMPLESLKGIVKFLQRLRVIVGEDLLHKVIAQLPELVFKRQLLDLETDDLRRVTKKDIEDLDQGMRAVLRLQTAPLEKPEDVCDKFCLAFALKCLKSPLQDKKFNGLGHIEESIETIARERKMIYRPPVSLNQVADIERKVRVLLDWIHDNRIMDLVFHRDNMRRELIVLTKKTVRFLQQEGELELVHVGMILDGILDHCHDKNRDVRDALYDTLIDSADKITRRDMARLIWATVRRMDPSKHYCSRTVKLMKHVLDGTRDRAFLLEVFAWLWSLVQDTSRAPMDAIQQALEMLPRLAEAHDIDLLQDAVSNVAAKRSGLQSLKLIRDIINKTPRARRTEVAEHVVVDQRLFVIAIDELEFYKRSAIAQAERHRKLHPQQQHFDWDNEILLGLFPHLEAVDTRLALLSSLLELVHRAPEVAYLKVLFQHTVKLNLTQKESDMGLEWICSLCKGEDRLAAHLFQDVFLEEKSLVMFTRSDTAFTCFLNMFFTVNHDAGHLRLKERDVYTSFEALEWPYIGFEELLLCLTTAAPPELFSKGKDILINLLTVIAPSHIENTEHFRQGFAETVFNFLQKSNTDLKTKGKQAAKWIDRLVGLLKDMVVLTRPKEEEKAPQQQQQQQGGDAAGGVEDDEEDEAQKPDPPTVLAMDKDKVLMFMEMMGAAFPPEYQYVMSVLLVKDANWDTNRAVENFLMSDPETKTAQYLEKAKIYKRWKGEDAANGAAGGAAGGAGGGQGGKGNSNAAYEGTPLAKIIARNPKNYDLLFVLLNGEFLDREAVWALLKMLPPDERLTRTLSQELAGGEIDWGTVLGDRPSYQFLYSLELIRQSVPTDEDSVEDSLRKTEWCRVFVLHGGFAFLFTLLTKIALKEDRGRIERACLGHLLRIMFFFMRAELQQGLGKSLDGDLKNDPLRFSQTSTMMLESSAPYRSLGTLMFKLLSERARRDEVAAVAATQRLTAPMTTSTAGLTAAEEADDADIVRFAGYLLVGSILRDPSILEVLANEADFSSRLLSLLCCPDQAMRTHFAQQLVQLCRDARNGLRLSSSSSGGGATAAQPAVFLVGQALSFIPKLLQEEGPVFRRSGAVFTLVSDISALMTDADLRRSVAAFAPWVDARKMPSAREQLVVAFCHAVVNRVPGREGGGHGEDQVLSGLLRALCSLIDGIPDQASVALSEALDKELKMVRVVLEDLLFEKGSGSRCCAAPTREAALQLVLRLCRFSPSNWEFVIRFLSLHHLSQAPLTSWRPMEKVESKKTRFVGLRNLRCTCYMNATLQQLFMMPELRNEILAAKVDTEKRGDTNMLWQFQKLMASLLHSDAPFADPEVFIKTLRDGNGQAINPNRQEDAYDFLARLQEHLEQQLSGQQSEKIFSKMFSVKMSQEIECRNGHARATAQEPEPVLQVDFKPTIEAALDSTFSLGGDPIDGYNCEGCGGKVDIVKRHMIHSASDHLVVMLRRFEWDYFAEGGNTRKKVRGHFEIPRRINLSPYTLDGIRQRRLGKTPNLLPEWEYELCGIVVHSGATMDSGHYYSIIRDPESEVWFKFDDRDVTPFGEEHLNEKDKLFIGECYMLLFQKVSEELSKSQLQLASSSILKVDNDILREVEATNATVVGERRFMELPYFGFLFDFLALHFPDPSTTYPDQCWVFPPEVVPPKGKEEEHAAAEFEAWKREVVSLAQTSNASLLAAQSGVLFVWETFVRARGIVGDKAKDLLTSWAEVVLPSLLNENVPACVWTIREILTRRRRWLRFFLLECEEQWIRQTFARWLVSVFKALLPTEVARGMFRAVPLSDGSTDAPMLATAAHQKQQQQQNLKPASSARLPIDPLMDIDDVDTEEAAAAAAALRSGGSGGVKASSSTPPAAAAAGVGAAVADASPEVGGAGPAASAAVGVTSADTIASQPLGLCAQLLDALMSLSEQSRAHWRRFSEFWWTIRSMIASDTLVRVHVACSMYPSYTRPLRALSLYVDFFMGEYSPYVKELPYEKQADRSCLGNKMMGGENADLNEHFWSMWEMMRVLHTGSPQMDTNPFAVRGPNGFVLASQTDMDLFHKHDMMTSLIKQGYNVEMNCHMVSLWSWNNANDSTYFLRILLDSFYKAEVDQYAGVMTVILAFLRLNDSLRCWRVSTMLAEHSSLMAFFRERRSYPSEAYRAQLDRLIAEVVVDPVLASWFFWSRAQWRWLLDWASGDRGSRAVAARLDDILLQRVVMADIQWESFVPNAAAAIPAAAAAGVAGVTGTVLGGPNHQHQHLSSTQVDDDDDDEEDSQAPGLLSTSTVRAFGDDDDDDMYLANSHGGGVD